MRQRSVGYITLSSTDLGWNLGGLYQGEFVTYNFLDIGIPGAVLETSLGAGVEVRWLPEHFPLELQARWSFEYFLNHGRQLGKDLLRNYLSLAVSWQH